MPVASSQPAAHSPWVWAIFLGVSWTWCIGMFLPVLLVRDLGPAAFVAFAVPNVVGAAAMGWVLHRPGLSEAWTVRHRFACELFSLVTILFHVFFAGWVISLLLGLAGGVAAIAVGVVVYLVGGRNPGRDATLAMLTYLASLVCVGLFLHFSHPDMPGPASRLPGASLKLFSLTPVCLFGFGLCPYLDLTFHRARQSCDAGGARIAFGAGFGLFFFSMICFTLIYSGLLADRLDGEPARLAGVIVGVHMVLQSGFTIAAHVRELLPLSGPARPNPTPTRRGERRYTVLVLVALALTTATYFLTRAAPHVGETPYLLFMGFYGLVAPTYVLASLLARGPVHAPIWLAGCLCAAPLYYFGFVHRQMVLLLPGLLLAVLTAVASARRVRALAAPAVYPD